MPDSDSPAPVDPSLNSTVASNPGRVELDHVHYLTCYPGSTRVFPIVSGIGLLVLAMSQQRPAAVIGLVLIGTGAGPMSWAVYKMRIWMANGDTCLGVILDPDSGMIAVLADMTTDLSESYPALKVMRAPLKRVPAGSFHKGQRITVVCTYTGPLESPHWKDVHPIPVVCATKNQATIERSLESVPDEQWDRLAGVVKTLHEPYTPGLRFLDHK